MTSKEQAKQFVQNHFGNSQFRTYNINIARNIGVEEAIVLNHLVDAHRYFEEHKKLFPLPKKEGLWFFYSAAKCEEKTAIKAKALFRIIKNLKSKDLITVVIAGVPGKRHFQLNFEAIYNLSNKNSRIPKWENYNSQMGILIYDPKEENKEESEKKNKKKKTGGQPPAPPIRSKNEFSQKIERTPHVQTTEEEHIKLAESPHTPELRDKAYQVLSDWKEDTPRSKWKKSDYRSIERWVFGAIEEKKRSPRRKKSRALDETDTQYDNLF